MIPAKSGRLARFKVFQCRERWQGKNYQQKRVEVVYVIEEALS
jgi:hypothetical protein